MSIIERIHKPVWDLTGAGKLNRQISWLAAMNLSTLAVGVFAYGDRFTFWEHAFSHLGGIHTISGNPNLLSCLLFSTGMISCGILCLYMGSVQDRLFKYLFRICGVGYFVMLTPWDINNTVHAAGAAVVFGTLWFFTVVVLRDLYKRIKKARWRLYQLLLQGTVLPYAFLYAIDSPLKQGFQKFAVLGLILALKLSAAEYAGVLKESSSQPA